MVFFLFFQAREALKKYLHYYERWENHARSLKLEEQTLANLKSRINQKVTKHTLLHEKKCNCLLNNKCNIPKCNCKF